MGHTTGGVGNSVSENIVGGGNTSAIGQAIGVSVGAIENSGISLSLGLGLGISRPLAVVSVGPGVSVSVSTAVSVSVAVSVGIGAGITVVSVVSISVSLGLGLGVSRPLAVVSGGAGDGDVGGVHTGGGLEARIASIVAETIGVAIAMTGISAEAIAVISVVSIGISLGLSGSKQGNCDSLEHYKVKIFPK